MVGALLGCRGFAEEDYDTLITKTTQYAAKLLKKPDQCRMVTMCSHLFWVGKQVHPVLAVRCVMWPFIARRPQPVADFPPPFAKLSPDVPRVLPA